MRPVRVVTTIIFAVILGTSWAFAMPDARVMPSNPEVWETFEDETLGLMPTNWERFTGSGVCVPNYDADWQVTEVSLPEGGVTRALSATQDTGTAGAYLSWCVYHGTTANMADGVIPSSARYYVESLLHARSVAQPDVEQEITLQPYFVDGGTYVEVMLLSYDEGQTWEVAVFQFYPNPTPWWKALSYPITETGWDWWGRVGMEIDRSTGEGWVYYNGQQIGGPLVFASVNTSDVVRANVRAANGLMDADDFRIYLMTGSLMGQVRASGTTTNLADATVEAYAGGQLRASATTNAKGIYSLQGLAPGQYVVVARKDGYASQTKANITVADSQTTYVNFALAPSSVLKGQVTERGTRIVVAGATVSAYQGGVLKASSTGGDNGVYSISANLPTGVYVVVASKTGYLPQTKAGINVTAGATTYVNFALQKICLAGQVAVAGDGAPIAGATVAAYQSEVLIAATTADANGAYRMGGLAPGAYDIVASQTGYLRECHDAVNIADGAVAAEDFALPLSGRLKGQVKNAVTGATVTGATIEVRQDDTLQATGATTAPYGIYDIASDLPAGTYTVSASAAGYVTRTKAGITITPGVATYVNFSLPPQ